MVHAFADRHSRSVVLFKLANNNSGIGMEGVTPADALRNSGFLKPLEEIQSIIALKECKYCSKSFRANRSRLVKDCFI